MNFTNQYRSVLVVLAIYLFAPLASFGQFANWQSYFKGAKEYERVGRYHDAEVVLKSSIEETKQITDQKLSEQCLSASLNELGMIYGFQNRLEEAESLLRQSLALSEKLSGPNSQGVGASLTNLANVLSDRERSTEALALYQRAIEIFARDADTSASHKRDMAVAMQNAANIYVKRGQFDEGIAQYNKAKKASAAQRGSKVYDVARVEANLGNVFCTVGDYEAAEDALANAISIARDTAGTAHPDFGAMLLTFAALQMELGNYDVAGTFAGRGLSIAEKGLDSSHPFVAAGLSTLGMIHRKQNKLTDAEKELLRSEEITTKNSGDKGLDSVGTKVALAEVYLDQNDPMRAFPLLQKSIEIYEESLPEDKYRAPGIFLALGRFYEAKDQLQDAEHNYKRALDIEQKFYRPDNIVTAETMEFYAGLLKKLNRQSEADSYQQRAQTIRDKVKFGQATPHTKAVSKLAGI
jgi:tetratricopeptide (TPR) repeat protein